MISIIVSSINTEQNILFKKNIEETIGVPYELLIHDNRETKWGLCKIYNYYARISKYDILCFFHEDISFETINWGNIIIDFFQQTPKAGVIGFAGATVKTKNISGWGTYRETCRKNICQHFKNGRVKEMLYNPYKELFSLVAVIDGLAMITTKKVWEQHPFDETLFTGFHLYDLDFSMQVAQKHNNYVCHIIKIKHFSEGFYSKEWFCESKKFHQKWETKLPFSVIHYPDKIIKKCENFSAYQLEKGELKHSWEKRNLRSIFKKQVKSPWNANSISYKLNIFKHILITGCKRILH